MGLGLIIGSFLNVLVIRSYTGKSLSGRSGCLSCGATLHPVDLIPIISWLGLRGRCRHCGSKLSVQYPLVEAATSILFGVVAGAMLPLLQHILTLTLFSTYIAIVAYDIRHTIIPDAWSALAALSALMLALVSDIPGTHILIIFVSGPLVALPLWLLWLTSRGRVIGLGDAKLAISFGYLLGIAHGFVGLVYGFIIGGMVALFVLLPWNRYERLYTRLVHPRRGRSHDSFTMKSEVPFGPFLVVGALLVWACLSFHISLPLFPYIV